VNTTSARARFVADGMATLTGPRLLLALYARLLRDLDDAAGAVRADRPNDAHTALVHAQDIVHELRLALDHDAWDGAGTLADVYEWTERLLVQANITKDAALVEECRALVEPLHDAWAHAANGTAEAASTPSVAGSEPARVAR
jgi:flagellar protein FliS